MVIIKIDGILVEVKPACDTGGVLVDLEGQATHAGTMVELVQKLKERYKSVETYGDDKHP